MPHSPGPWTLELPDFDYAKDVHDEAELSPDNDQDFATLSAAKWSHFAYVAVVCGGDRDDEGMANAKLIAAAPEMLALCELLQVVVANQPQPLLGDWDWPSLAEQLGDVIAKAKG